KPHEYSKPNFRLSLRMNSKMDLLLINPGGRDVIYQDLGTELSAVETPLWCRLIAGYVADRGFVVDILDSEADNLTPESVVDRVSVLGPRLVGIIVYGHQPSASTQQMAAAGPLCRAIKNRVPDQPIVIAGGHVAALPERTLGEESVDFACNGEGPITIGQLLQALIAGSTDLSSVEGLVWRDNGHVRQNASPPLIKDLDADLHGNVWHMLPMQKYRAHNWQCFGNLKSRRPYASIYTTLGC